VDLHGGCERLRCRRFARASRMRGCSSPAPSRGDRAAERAETLAYAFCAGSAQWSSPNHGEADALAMAGVEVASSRLFESAGHPAKMSDPLARRTKILPRDLPGRGRPESPSAGGSISRTCRNPQDRARRRQPRPNDPSAVRWRARGPSPSRGPQGNALRSTGYANARAPRYGVVTARRGAIE